jgi:lysophospholipase L1-like esterase
MGNKILGLVLPLVSICCFSCSSAASVGGDYSYDPSGQLSLSSVPLSLRGKKMIFIGDSIIEGNCSSEGNDFVSLVSKYYGCTSVNYGVGGATLCTGLSGRSLLQFILDFDEQTDFLFIGLGSNDFWDSNEGSGLLLGEEDSLDSNTVYGAFNLINKHLAEKYAGTDVKVCLLTPITGYFDASGGFGNERPNNQGNTLNDFCHAIIVSSDNNGVRCFDMNKYCGIYYSTDSDQNCDDLLADNVHPNDLGYEYMANALICFINSSLL